jgi:hypothetical protein
MHRKKHETINIFDHLPIEIVKDIFCLSHDNSNKKSSPLKTLKTVMSLDVVCKKFRQALDLLTIKAIFQHYDKEQKDQLLNYVIAINQKTIISSIDYPLYQSNRKIIWGLINSEASLEKNILIRSALEYDDKKLIQFLFDKNQIHQSTHDWNDTPIFFYAQTIEMIQLCQDNNIKLLLDTSGKFYLSRNHDVPNILWAAISNHKTPSKMVEFYLNKNVSLQPRFDGCTLLHELARCCSPNTNIDNMLNKGKLLLAKEPLLINCLNKELKSPLDCAKQSLNRRFALFDDTTPAQELIRFLKENNGKTSKKLLPHKPKEDTDECVLF